MSHKIVETWLSDGPSKAVVSYYFESDGVESELSNFVLVEPKVDFTPAIDKMSIQQIWYSFSWFDALLTFDDLVPYPSWMLTRDTSNYMDFRYFGGIADRSGIDHTGKLLISTNGFAAAGSVGTLIVEIKKN